VAKSIVRVSALESAVVGSAGLAVATFAGALLLDARRRAPLQFLPAMWQALRAGRRQYAAFLAHLGIVCLAIGIAGSSLRSREQSATLRVGEPYVWDDASVRLIGVEQRKLADVIVLEAELLVTSDNAAPFTLRPAQHWHRLQREWTTEVAIHSRWGRDFYVILHGNEATDQAGLTFVVNPLMRWLWTGGSLAVVAALVAVWPSKPAAARGAHATLRGPHFRREASLQRLEAKHG
jgi:cytochrome c-type biogenesis protein CcmF